MRHQVSVFTLALFASLCACSLDYGYVQTLPATLELSDADSVVFLVPSTVQQDVPFDVSVRSYGGGCVTKGPFDVLTPFDTVAVLNPYEIVRSGSGVVCTQELRVFTHSATLTFAQPGQVEVRVVGRDRAGVSMSRTKLVEVQ